MGKKILNQLLSYNEMQNVISAVVKVLSYLSGVLVGVGSMPGEEGF